MCRHSHEISLRHCRHSIYVDCGHCPSCLQHKADRRAIRIASHGPAFFKPAFVTLTYNDSSVPYIRRSDLLFELSSDYPYIVIYRDSKFVRHFGSTELISCPGCSVDSIEVDGDLNLFDSSFDEVVKSLPRLAIEKGQFDTDRVGVCYSKDFRDFIKRLRSLLARKYGSVVPISYYQASEYGPTTVRPHFHALIWIPVWLSFQDFSDFCAKSWPFADSYRTKKYVQLAKCAASYVSKYVNCSSNVPLFLQDYFPPKCSHSVDFGFDNVYFGFDEVFNNLSVSHCAEFTTSYYKKDVGFVSVTSIYPRYVINRYFLKVKGFNRISRDALYLLYTYPQQYLKVNKGFPAYRTESGVLMRPRLVNDVSGEPVYMSDEEVRYFINGLFRRFKDYFLPNASSSSLVNSWDSYCRCVVDSLITYNLAFLGYVYRHNSDEIDDIFYNYDNSFDAIFNSRVDSDLPDLYFNSSNMHYIPPHPSDYPRCIEIDKRRLDSFNKNIKKRKLSEHEFTPLTP